jgi:hypothetical protein
MLLVPQKASLVDLWQIEWCFGISTLKGLSVMPF